MSELEVLSSIYGDCIELKSLQQFSMKFLPYIGDERDKAFLFVQMEFFLPAGYPDTAPSFSIVKHKGLDEDSLNKFTAMLKQRYL